MALGVTLWGAPVTSHAQTDQDVQTWTALIAAGKIKDDSPVAAWFDGHVRRGDAGTTLILRPGIGYVLAPWASVWVGYAWVPVFLDASGERIDEQRAWQQVILQHTWGEGAWKLQSRTRFEQRFNQLSDDMGLRLREFVRLDYRPSAESWFGAVVWDELFWGLNAPGFAPEGYDQNRLFLGAAFHANPALRVEAGYLFVHLNREPNDQIQHVMALNFFAIF